MPVYCVLTSGIDLDGDQRDRLAHAFAAIHHAETQSPIPFVRTTFHSLPAGLVYTDDRTEPALLLHILLGAGRDHGTIGRIMHRCHDLVLDVSGLPPDQILVVTTETPASLVIEAGLTLPKPEPVAEAQWFDTLRSATPDRYDGF